MACLIRRGWQTAGPDCTASPHGRQSGAPSCGQIDRWPIGPVGSRTTPALSAASAGSVPFFHLANRGARVSRTPYLTGIRRPAAGATALRFAEVGPRVGRWRSSAGGDWSGPFFSPDNCDGCDLGTAGRCSIRKVPPGSVIGTAHFAFTGHQIRIARSGAALRNALAV